MSVHERGDGAYAFVCVCKEEWVHVHILSVLAPHK